MTKHKIIRQKIIITIVGLILGTLCMQIKTKAQSSHENQSKGHQENSKHHSRITDEVLPLQLDGFPERPKPLLELGDPLLNTGKLSHGFRLPTGAVWRPSFIVWGTFRTALQTFEIEEDRVSEWANRFDLFGNLYLTSTERIVIGIRPLDDRGQFTGYTFKAPENVIEGGSGFEEEFNRTIRTLFFEGDFGELFPFLDKRDKRGLDFGLSVGRQPIRYQGGMLIDDNIDAMGISKINLKPRGAVNYRSTFLWGWNEINRSNLPSDDNSASLFGWFNEIDWRASTVALDLIFINANGLTGDGIYTGVSAIQRIGRFNTTLRVLGSLPIGEETIHNSAGALIFTEISWTPYGNHNLVYANGFWGIGDFRSASRDPTAGGPLGPTGILYSAVGLGRYPAALSNSSDNSLGGAIGYQLFSHNTRKQLILELGSRYTSADIGQTAIGVGARGQVAFGRRGIVRLDTYAVYSDRQPTGETIEANFDYGARLELLYKF